MCIRDSSCFVWSASSRTRRLSLRLSLCLVLRSPGNVWQDVNTKVVTHLITCTYIIVQASLCVVSMSERTRTRTQTLMLKDSSIRSIWTYLTASPCYTTDTNKHNNTRERERNKKTLILKDSSVRSIWTYLTGSLCCTTNTNKHDNTTNKYYKHD